MSAREILQHLYSLDNSSPNFLRVLYGLIRHDEDEQYSSSLGGEELAQLVDFLDDVCPLLLVFSPVPNQAPQALNTIPTSDDVFRQCLRKLRAICGYHTTLPTSHVIRGDLARTGESAIAFGGFADVWQGTHDGRRVCIKVFRVSLNDRESLTKVRVPLQPIFLGSLFTEDRPVGAIVILQRGHRVETVKTSKCRPFPWSYEQTFTICVGVDAKWDFNALR